MEYEAVIGLETHVQLKTKSKMWCGCANAFGAEPNTNVCPVCLGMPGVLPVANEEALKLTVLTGLLLNCEIPPRAKFDRKNYFYPDVAKNYQITQYDRPSTQNGCVEFEFNGGLSRVHITRAHLEEDVGKNFHFDRNSGVDFNRAGVPLMEIVSEPDLTSADQAYEYLNALVEILRYGKISDCDMEKGMVRCDVNVSIRPVGTKELGAKIEIKNMNSFSGVRRALEYEIPRQIEVLKKGGKLIQSTRRWNDVAEITEEMRTKEHAHDYRYFPEPDLMPLAPTEKWLEKINSRVVELPLARKERFMQIYRLTADQAEALKNDSGASSYFERCAQELVEKKLPTDDETRILRAIVNTIIQQWRPRLDAKGMDWSHFKIEPSGSNAVSQSFVLGEINSTGYQQVVIEMFESDRNDVQVIILERGLVQVSDTHAIEKLCDEVITSNPGPVDDFKSGKTVALNFLKGQVMKLSKGKANLNLAGAILEKKLKT
ncbi:MAG TPA: Asp-tRNA(Asn)/Glu-tRNA(Gln) amidotransferase subunit GatB [Verrucomicrobiae bacterium]